MSFSDDTGSHYGRKEQEQAIPTDPIEIALHAEHGDPDAGKAGGILCRQPGRCGLLLNRMCDQIDVLRDGNDPADVEKAFNGGLCARATYYLKYKDTNQEISRLRG